MHSKTNNMAKIYDVPSEIELPQFDFSKPYSEYKAKEDEYLAKVKKLLVDHNPTEHVGEIITFPVADGQACYMVASLKPVCLVHLPIGDAWNFQYVHLLTKKEVVLKIQQQNSFNKMWASHKK